MTRRVLIVCHLLGPHVGGVENLVALEARALAEAGCEVVVLTSDGGGAGRPPEPHPQVEIVRLPAWHVLERTAAVPYPLFGPRLAGELRRRLAWCDAVHVHGFLFQTSAVAVGRARAAGKPCLLTDHGGFQRYSSRLVTLAAWLGAHTVGRLTVTGATRVRAYNARVQRDLAAFRRDGAVAFLPNPVDRRVFRPPQPNEREAARAALGWPADRPRALFVGRLLEAKGTRVLEAAAAGAFDVSFCGPGRPDAIAARPPAVERLSSRPQAELVPLYQAADVLVLPALPREGFPLVVQEALACGCPAVLGEDEGFAPYRGLAGLRLCPPTVEGVRTSVQQALTAGRSPEIGSDDPRLPTPAAWTESLLELLFGRGAP